MRLTISIVQRPRPATAWRNLSPALAPSAKRWRSQGKRVVDGLDEEHCAVRGNAADRRRDAGRQRVSVQPRPGAPLEVAEAKFLLQLLVRRLAVALND